MCICGDSDRGPSSKWPDVSRGDFQDRIGSLNPDLTGTIADISASDEINAEKKKEVQ